MRTLLFCSAFSTFGEREISRETVAQRVKRTTGRLVVAGADFAHFMTMMAHADDAR